MKHLELIKKMSEVTGISQRESHLFLEKLVEVVIEELKNGGSIHIRGLVTITSRIRHERYGINPQTMDRMLMPAVRVAKFKTGAMLKGGVK
jgi:DNA-binding protein HU-beta